MNHKDLIDRRVIVTGGAGGIGFACARHLLDRGASVTLADVDANRLQAAQARLNDHRVVAVVSSLGNATECRRVVAAAGGPLHALVHMAGVFEHDPLDPDDRSVWERAMSESFLGSCFAVRVRFNVVRQIALPMLQRRAALLAWFELFHAISHRLRV